MAPVDLKVSIRFSWWVKPAVRLVAALQYYGFEVDREKAFNLIVKHGVKTNVT